MPDSEKLEFKDLLAKDPPQVSHRSAATAVHAPVPALSVPTSELASSSASTPVFVVAPVSTEPLVADKPVEEEEEAEEVKKADVDFQM